MLHFRIGYMQKHWLCFTKKLAKTKLLEFSFFLQKQHGKSYKNLITRPILTRRHSLPSFCGEEVNSKNSHVNFVWDWVKEVQDTRKQLLAPTEQLDVKALNNKVCTIWNDDTEQQVMYEQCHVVGLFLIVHVILDRRLREWHSQMVWLTQWIIMHFNESDNCLFHTAHLY